jgi:hypothetical protein
MNLSEPLVPFVPVKEDTLGGKPSGHGRETEGAEGGEDSRESRGHVVLKLGSTTWKIGIHEGDTT